MILDNRVILEKIRAFFQDPVFLPDLPRYIVAVWRVSNKDDFKTAEDIITEKEVQGAIFNTNRVEDLRSLYLLLTQDSIKDLRLYQITPQRIAFLLEMLGVKA